MRTFLFLVIWRSGVKKDVEGGLNLRDFIVFLSIRSYCGKVILAPASFPAFKNVFA